MISTLGDKTTVIMGYGDIIISVGIIDGTPILSLLQSDEAFKIGEEDQELLSCTDAKEVTTVQFDDVDSLTILIDQLKKLRKKMKVKRTVYSFDGEWSKTKE